MDDRGQRWPTAALSGLLVVGLGIGVGVALGDSGERKRVASIRVTGDVTEHLPATTVVTTIPPTTTPPTTSSPSTARRTTTAPPQTEVVCPKAGEYYESWDGGASIIACAPPLCSLQIIDYGAGTPIRIVVSSPTPPPMGLYPEGSRLRMLVDGTLVLDMEIPPRQYAGPADINTNPPMVNGVGIVSAAMVGATLAYGPPFGPTQFRVEVLTPKGNTSCSAGWVPPA